MHAYGQSCVFERHEGAASASLPRTYRPRAPQKTALHRVVRENLLNFLAEGVEQSVSGEGYPYYVEKEFRSYLNCGDLSQGFARIRCQDCGYEQLLPFSCKNRGVCPSCTARRMSDEAAYLVDILLPQANYRQWTITFPWAIRFLMAKDYKLITAILNITMRALFTWQRRQAKRAGYRRAKTAAVAFVQRFGGALNSNLHFHVLMPDGVFVLDENENLCLIPLAAPENDDVLFLLQKIARRVAAFCEKPPVTIVVAALDDTDGEAFERAIAEAMRHVPRVSLMDDMTEDDAPKIEETKVKTQRRAASMDGFSIHANTSVPANSRAALEKLCRYGMRPAFSHERLSLTDDGRVILSLRKPWPNENGVSALQFEPTEFLRRLSPLIPPPFAHLIRYFGLFAPNAKLRDLLPAAPVSGQGIRPESLIRAGDLPSPTSPPQPVSDARPRRKTFPWADLLRRVFSLDVLVCPRCLGPLTVIAFINEIAVVEKILAHLGQPTKPPRLSPVRLPAQIEIFDDQQGDEAGEWPTKRKRKEHSRAPPEDEMADGAKNTDDWGA